MKWIEITVFTTSFGSDIVAEEFFDMGASGVVVVDSKDIKDALASDKMWDYVDEELLKQSENVRVLAFATPDILDKTIKNLRVKLLALKEREQIGLQLGSLEMITREIDDEDWINIWKKYYKPIVIKDVVICPEWIDYQSKAGQTVVKIQPGMAFGTGEHETTSMCIDLMQDLDISGKDIFDVGCGSGILGITAASLGASSCLMVDFDSQAISAAKYNAKLNNICENVNIVQGDLLSHVQGKAGIIIANITADVLIKLSEDIKKYILPKGKVILSGLIHSRLQDVLQEYKDAGFKIARKIKRGEWNGVLLSYVG